MSLSEEKMAELANIMDEINYAALARTGSGRVSIVDFGRYLRKHGIDISDFAILRISCTGRIPKPTVDSETFDEVKDTILLEIQNRTPEMLEERKRRLRANYMDLWREHSGSRDESGELPVSELSNVVFSECNPTKELLDTLTLMKQDGSEGLTFWQFCEILDNLPKSGMVDEALLLKAFQAEDREDKGYITRSQLYTLLIANGDDPLTKEDIDEMMEDCGDGDKFMYKDWIERVSTTRSLSED